MAKKSKFRSRNATRGCVPKASAGQLTVSAEVDSDNNGVLPTGSNKSAAITPAALWKDPVWSKVIASGITAIIGSAALLLWSHFRVSSEPAGPPKSKPTKVEEGTKTIERPMVDVRNNFEFQPSFEVVGGMHQFWWPAVFDIINDNDVPLTISGLEVLWGDAGFQLRTSNAGTAFVDIFDEAGALTSLVLKKKAIKDKSHFDEKLPIIIPARSQRHLRLHYLVRVVPPGYGRTLVDDKITKTARDLPNDELNVYAVPFKSDEEGYQLLRHALNLKEPPTICEQKILPIRVMLTNGAAYVQFVPTLLFIAKECFFSIPFPRDEK